MSLPRFVVGMLLVDVMVPGAGVVSAQDPSTGSGQVFPTRPIRIFTSAAGETPASRGSNSSRFSVPTQNPVR